MVDSTPPTATISSNGTPAFSCFRRTVTLYDWWLVKSSLENSQGNRLAISGISSRKEEAVRFFVSTPIIKRYDVFSLETADGLYVITRGFINEKRTLENGFSPQIVKIFLYGFPPNWESYTLECFKEEYKAGIDLGNAVPDDVSVICQETFSDGKYLGDGCEENPIPTSLVLPEDAPGKYKKLFAAEECKESGEMSVVDVSNGSVGDRRSTRLHNIKVYQQKQHPASGGTPKHPDKDQSFTSKKVENCDSYTAFSDNVTANLPEISSNVVAAVEKFFSTSLVSPEKTAANCNKAFLEDEQEMSIKMGEVNVVHGSGGNRHSARLHNVKLCQKKQPSTGGSATHPDKDQISTLKAMEKCDLDTAVPDNVSASHPEISYDAVEKAFTTSLVSLDKPTRDCNKTFLEDELDMSIKTAEFNVVHGSCSNRCSAQMRNVKLCQKKQPATGDPATHLDKDQFSASTALENSDGGLESLSMPVQSQKGIVNTLSGQVINKFRSRNSKTFSAKTEGCYKKKRVAVETEAVTPKRESFKPTSSVKSPQGRDVSHSNKGSQQRLSTVSPESLSLKKSRSGRWLLPPLEFWRNQQPIYNMDRDITEIQEGSCLHKIKVCQQKPKQHPVSRGHLKHPDEEPRSTSMAVENHDSAVENYFPTSLESPDKTTENCNKAFLEDERDMSIKTGEVNVVLDSGGNRRSAQMRNVKLYQKKQPATGDPATHPDKDKISASATLEMSDGGQESLLTPVQSQKGRVNTMSGQVTNKLSSRISKTFSAKTEGCYKKKRVTFETEAVTPKRKIIKPASSVKSPQGRDVSHSNKESTPRLSTVSPESLSLKKSRSGRWLLPPLEFWRNQQPIYNMDREITEIQEGSSLISPFRGSSPSLGRSAKNMRGGKRIVTRAMQKL